MAKEEQMNVFIVAYPGVNILDVAGPVQVFTTANETARLGTRRANPPYQVHVIATQPGLTRTTSGIGIGASGLPKLSATTLDTVLVAGGHGAEAAGRDALLSSWLASAQPRSRRFGSICTGAFVLAGAELLKGRRVATHWAYCDQLQASHPDLNIERDAIFVEEDGFWSSAGISAGMDLALAMVERDLGRDLALQVARRLVVFLKRPGGQSQFSMPLQAQTTDGPLSKLMSEVLENPAQDCRVERLAEVAGVSERSLFRLFRNVAGVAPASWVEQVRTERARRLLEDGGTSIDRIASECGFRSSEVLRRVFVRRLGIAPNTYRERFAAEPAAQW